MDDDGEGVNLAQMITRLMTTAHGLAETARDVFERSDVNDPQLKARLNEAVNATQDVMNRVKADPEKFGKLSPW